MSGDTAPVSYSALNGSAQLPNHTAVVGNAGPQSDGEAHSRYPEPDHSEHRLDIEAALTSFSGLLSHSMRPLPEQTGDGSYLQHDVHPSFFKDLSTIGLNDVKTLKDKIVNGKAPIDDKTMLMERVIQLVASLPDRSVHRAELTNTFVDQLFTTLQHPPLSYLGDQFR